MTEPDALPPDIQDLLQEERAQQDARVKDFQMDPEMEARLWERVQQPVAIPASGAGWLSSATFKIGSAMVLLAGGLALLSTLHGESSTAFHDERPTAANLQITTTPKAAPPVAQAPAAGPVAETPAAAPVPGRSRPPATRKKAPALTTEDKAGPDSFAVEATSDPAQPTPSRVKDSPEERLLLEAARQDLSRGDAQAAMKLLEKHGANYPNGRLCEERDALLVMSWLTADRPRKAREMLTHFKERYPNSLLLPGLASALENAP